MVVFNPLKKEIDLKIVYYGPAVCGKTTNLQSVHMSLNPKQRGELVSLATKDDRTLFFDFLPVELGSIKGFKTRFHIYTVPGQVFYTLTRRAVLTGVDGIIFIADSQEGKMEENLESMNDLKENLKYYNKDLGSVPFVIQYNKRDLENVLSLEEMGSQLNTHEVPSFVASAINGKGVMETLTVCCKMVLKQIQDKSKYAKPAEKEEADEDKDKQAIKRAINDLPTLKLVESPKSDDSAADIQQSLYKDQEEQSAEPESQPEEVTEVNLKNEEGFDQVKEEVVESDREMVGQKEPISEKQEEPLVVNDLLEEKADIKLSDSETLVNENQGEFQEEALKGEPKIELEVQSSGMDVEEEDIGTVDDSLSEEVAKSKDLEDEDDKRTCPRCSLKFKLNVKQCPICKISLVQEEEGNTDEKELEFKDETAHLAETSLEEEVIGTSDAAGPGLCEQGLEIISCGQPQKVSSTAIKVPLVMKIDSNGQEFKINMAINFEGFFLQPRG